MRAALIVAVTLALGTVANAACITASWYHEDTRTANGERYWPDGLTAAHRTLPFGTRLRVMYGDRKVTVRVNDRGPCTSARCQRETPHIRDRELDLSRGAARKLGLLVKGVATVCYEEVT